MSTTLTSNDIVLSLRPYYHQAQGILNSISSNEYAGAWLNPGSGMEIYDSFNSLVEKIEAIILENQEDFHKEDFKVNPDKGSVFILSIRSSLDSLIRFLYGKYFYEHEEPPIKDMPGKTSISFNQNISQNQEIIIQNFIEEIEKMTRTTEGEQKKFWDIVLEKSKQIKAPIELISLINNLIQNWGS
jgi:hypothetical protein